MRKFEKKRKMKEMRQKKIHRKTEFSRLTI